MDAPFDFATGLRLAFIYMHLLFCVFALHAVPSADLRVLQGRVTVTWTARWPVRAGRLPSL